jgi:hypothetical protein
MASSQPPAAPADRVTLYDRLLAAADPPIARKGAGNPYTSLNGHMFSFLPASGVLALRLPVEARERVLNDHAAVPFIVRTASRWSSSSPCRRLCSRTPPRSPPGMEISRACVAGRKPKPNTRGKTTGDA